MRYGFGSRQASAGRIRRYPRKEIVEIDQLLSDYLADLSALCVIDSGDYHAEGTRAIAEYFDARFRKLGLQTEIRCYDGNRSAPFLTARNGDSEEIDLLLAGHLDTVYPVGTAKARPLTVDPNKIAYAPGAADCKGGCLLTAVLLEELRREGDWPFRFCVAFSSDEEK